ncbi:urea carboxylase-associated family protein [Variovorax dokdonensis]|uniref:Urea carboxylase-associated family protein n=1 Tax=Variovorax dokdonensis TaxID=344883 RepID=A0ABT7N5C0_9BURK|nr:urea carboxylase-associated family protein [Variovorax dokdonensis]MDM0043128.1 urea carboxylase-associated family protein [Variovorax dokdonensis]
MSQTLVRLRLNQQQKELLDRCMATGDATDLQSLASRALREWKDGVPSARPASSAAPNLEGLSSEREVLYSHIIEPGTGKAVEVLAGQVLRIEQVEGGQCADLNVFNLHDYKEFMHVGRTRTLHGFNPGPGDFLWSAPPRERAMLYLLADTVRCNDVMFPRCSANLYESAYGFARHTNCHDIQSEAQREYGLTPDDVHDSFNLFMNTVIEGARGRIERQTSKAGDHVEMLALMDVLAVPNVCGADVMRTSNFSLKPLKVEIYSASERDRASLPAVPTWDSQRTPADFRQPNIKTDRALRRDDNYQPQFTNVPILEREHEVLLDDEERALLASLGLHQFYGQDQAAQLRDVIFSWWEKRYLG